MTPIRRHRGAGPRLLAATAAATALAGLAGCERTAESREPPPPPTVTVVAARTATVPIQAKTTGTTRALEEVTIRARVQGFLKEQLFREGADVKAGQLLLVIDEEPFQVKLESAQAQLAEAEAALQKAKQSKMREVAQAQLALDQAMLLLAQVDEARQRALVQRSAASRQDVDQAEANRKKNEAQVESDRASLEQARADYDVNILTAQANVAAAQAAVREAQINLGYCRMSAPIDGRIGEAKVKVGNLVGPQAGGDASELATIQQLDPMGVDVRPASKYLARAAEVIRTGLDVHLTFQGVEGDQPYPDPGRAFFIDNTVDPNTSTFLVKASVPNPQKVLLPGEYVKVDVIVGEHPDAIVVPEQAVMEGQVGPTVYVVDGQGTVSVVRVKAIDTYQGLRVLESGLRPGQEVIVEGLQLVRPGMKVRTEAAAPDEAPADTGTDARPPGKPEGPADETTKTSERQEAPPRPSPGQE